MSSRSVTCKLDGKEWRMPATLAVSKRIAEEVCDPLKTTMLMGKGLMPLSNSDIMGLLFIGLSSAGCKHSRERIEELIFAAGTVNFLPVCSAFLAAMVDGRPERALPGEDPKEQAAQPG